MVGSNKHMLDPHGNALQQEYDNNLRIDWLLGFLKVLLAMLHVASGNTLVCEYADVRW